MANNSDSSPEQHILIDGDVADPEETTTSIINPQQQDPVMLSAQSEFDALNNVADSGTSVSEVPFLTG
jgi:hypothetical protein